MTGNKLASMGLAAAAVVLVLIVGCSSRNEPSADPSAPPLSDPAASSAADDLLRDFLAARVAGEGAEQYLNVHVHDEDIPLLYATSSGAPYERAEFDRVSGIEWPYGLTAFTARLFAGNTVVEQLFFTNPEVLGRPPLEYRRDGFGTHIAPTTENGRPVAVPYDFSSGAVTLQVPHPWVSLGGWGARIEGLTIRLIPDSRSVAPTTDGGERNDWDELDLMADPALLGACYHAGPSPATADALAEIIRSNDLGATAPVAVSAGGIKALMMDVVVTAGANVPYCENEFRQGILGSLVDPDRGGSSDGKGHATGYASGERMRLYLFDGPEGSPMRVLAIAITAPESRFESVVEAAAPVVDSVEFHVR